MVAPSPSPQPGTAEARQVRLRLAALARTGLLDSGPEPVFDTIVELVRGICRAPIALVSLVDAERQWFKARLGVEVDETPIDTSVCALAIRQSALFVVPDLAADPRTRDFSLVREAPHLRFYAGFPIVTHEGVAIGSLCAIDTEPRPDGLTAEQAIALEALARQTAAEIDRRGLLRPQSAAGAPLHSIGMWDWDVVADRVTADPGFARLYGVDPEVAARGAPIGDFFGGIHGEDLPRLRGAIDAALTRNVPLELEYRVTAAGGRPRWVTAQARAIRGADGQVLRLPGVSYDIDARKTAELRLAALVALNDLLAGPGEPADLAFAAAELLGRTLEVDRAAYGVVDPEAGTIVIDRDWTAPGAASIAGAFRFSDYGEHLPTLTRGETVALADVREDARTAERAAAWEALSVRAVINAPVTERGGFVALFLLHHHAPREWSREELAFVRDVAERTRSAVERRRAEQELAALTAGLEQTVEQRTRALMVAEESLRQAAKMEAVGQLTGGIAHDFNNLLTGISGALEMIQLRIDQGRINELGRYADAAQGAARRAAALTHRLLAFSRRQTLDPKPTDVNRLVAEMADLVRRTVGPAIDVSVVEAAGLWPTMIDPNQLENALLNLCINARDAMPEGGRITIETANTRLDARAAAEHDLTPGHYVALSVTDSGSGMPPEVQARAFDPFFTTKPLGEGTGLGLSMIYGFVRQSGGQVRILSEVGVGTTMRLYLPRHYGEVDEEDEERGDAMTPAPERRTVLVVDDEPTIRMLVVEVLDTLGLTAFEAGDGAAALRVLQSGAAIDLLITDIGIPGALNGRQVADAALALMPQLKVLFITGYAETAVFGDGRLGPNMALVTKPFAMDALARAVHALLA